MLFKLFKIITSEFGNKIINNLEIKNGEEESSTLEKIRAHCEKIFGKHVNCFTVVRSNTSTFANSRRLKRNINREAISLQQFSNFVIARVI